MKKLLIALLVVATLQTTFAMDPEKIDLSGLGSRKEIKAKMVTALDQFCKTGKKLHNTLNQISTYNIDTLKELSGLVWSFHVYMIDILTLNIKYAGGGSSSWYQKDEWYVAKELKECYLRIINIIDINQHNLPISMLDKKRLLVNENSIKDLVELIKSNIQRRMFGHFDFTKKQEELFLQKTRAHI